MLSDLLALIFKVAQEDRHMMTHIAYVHPEEGEQQIVSIWAGAGMANALRFALSVQDDEDGNLVISKENRQSLAETWSKHCT